MWKYYYFLQKQIILIRKYYELYANKLDNLDELDKSTQEETENLNRPIIRD